MACPCAGPRSRVRRTNMSSVPCKNSTRSFSSPVDILGEVYGYSPRMSRGEESKVRSDGKHAPPRTVGGKKKPHARKGVEHRVLLQSASEDDRPVLMLALAGHKSNLIARSTCGHFRAPGASAILP